MARREVVVDDLDGGQHSTVKQRTVVIDGKTYTVDLSDANWQAIQASLKLIEKIVLAGTVKRQPGTRANHTLFRTLNQQQRIKLKYDLGLSKHAQPKDNVVRRWLDGQGR